METTNTLPDCRADLLSVLRGGHLAGSYRPNRLIRYHQASDLLSGQAFQAPVQLAQRVRYVAPGLADSERLANAKHGRHLVCEHGPYLGADQGVVLAVMLSPLRVPGQDEAAAELGQHPRAYVAGVGAVGVRGDVLRAVPQPELVA